MIKSNPLIERSRAPDGVWSFQYRKKFIIRYAIGYTMCIYAFSCFFMLFHAFFFYRNKHELRQNIDRIENGILVEDISKCYSSIGE